MSYIPMVLMLGFEYFIPFIELCILRMLPVLNI